jgi:hypothetical protein
MISMGGLRAGVDTQTEGRSQTLDVARGLRVERGAVVADKGRCGNIDRRGANRRRCHAAPNKRGGGSVLAALSERGRTE